MNEEQKACVETDGGAASDRMWVRYLPLFLRKRFQSRHVFQEAVENSGWLVGDKLLRMGIGLLVGVWVARYLGPAQFGIMSYAGSVAGLAGAIAGLGIDSIVIRDLVRYPERSDEFLGTAFVLRFFSGLVCYLVMLGIVIAIKPGETLTHVIVAIIGWTLTIGAFDTADLWFQSKVMSKYVVYARSAGFLISALVRLVLIFAKASLVAFAVTNLVEIGIGAIALLYAYYRKNGCLRRWKARLPLAKELVHSGWPVLLGGIVSMICLRVDQVILGQISNPKELGVYAAAVRVAELWFFLPSAIIASVFPNIIKAKEVDEEEFYKRLQKLFNFLAFAGYAVAIPVTFLGPFVINLLYGKAYSGAAPMLIILIWSDLFINLAMARGAYLFAMNWTWILLGVNAVAAVVNIALNLVLIPHYGGTGAAVASLLSYWVSAHGVCFLIKPLRRGGQMMTRALLWPKFW
ncbi:flippase [Geomonas sp. RF6]|uniref:flippase n=1 Tax=Geomonas sp. RF6 TaxID=2897342 RepID=UPI001E3B6A5F|nr:flippase [Geomonas sp. RF6]UFS72697.1 flippase [Geomonas sp. RF6]